MRTYHVLVQLMLVAKMQRLLIIEIVGFYRIASMNSMLYHP